MAKKQSKTKNQGGSKKASSDTISVVHQMPSLIQVFHETHHVIVAHCEYCGKPLNRSEVNDFGSLCEKCYMEEYYGK